MRMILAQDVANNTGALFVRLVPETPQLIHGEEDTAMHGFQTIAKVRQRSTNDNAHGVLEVGLLHLVLDVDVEYSIVFWHLVFWHQCPSLRQMSKL